MRKSILPSPALKTNWVKATREFFDGVIIDGRPKGPSAYAKSIIAEANRCASADGWNPKVVKLAGYRVCLDTCFQPERFGGELNSYQTAILCDHPFLRFLNDFPNVPRAVKAPFRKENRLKHLRSDEAFPVLEDLERANEAWDKYQDAVGFVKIPSTILKA